MRYLLDSDSLITAKNLYYRLTFCLGFWEWIEFGNLAEKVFSIDYVYKELRAGSKSDFLHQWALNQNTQNAFFLSTENCLIQWGKISKWA